MIESLCSSLGQCLSKWRRLAASQNRHISPLLQLVCCATFHLARYLSQLIQSLNLSDKVKILIFVFKKSIGWVGQGGERGCKEM